MLTKKERELVDYYKNLKPGIAPFKSKILDDEPKEEVVKVEVNMDDLAEEIIDRMWDII